MRFQISPPTLTLNSWRKLCYEPIKNVMFNPTGKDSGCNIEVVKVDNPRKTRIDFTVYSKNEEEYGIHYLVSLDKSCFDDKKTGKNKSLEELHEVLASKNNIGAENNLGNRPNDSFGIISSCVLKMSKLFDPLMEYTIIHPTSMFIGYRVAGVYGDAVIIGYSEADIERKLEEQMVNLFS